jgi:site-specific DNA-methyltransferase (cytosine-N4-specific)
MAQLNLFNMAPATERWQVNNFSANCFGIQSARVNLEQKLIDITEISNDFNRQSVSYQLSKNDCLHRWLKYKEGFSAELVKNLLNEFGTQVGDTILDPFVGSGTTALVCKMNGINSIGLDILPTSQIAIDAKKSVFEYDTAELKQMIDDVESLQIPNHYTKRTLYINITDGAYPDETEREIAFFTEWNKTSDYSGTAKNLTTLCILNALEKVSYTSKDGQFLRWDYRSKKMEEAAEYRQQNGKKPFVIRLDKGKLPMLKQTLLEELHSVFADIVLLQNNTKRPPEAAIQFVEGSALYELPKLADGIINGVITSPPYCNRYDYTRTYALELNYLNANDDTIKDLRQSLLSCTVENKSKLQALETHYAALNKKKDYDMAQPLKRCII